MLLLSTSCSDDDGDDSDDVTVVTKEVNCSSRCFCSFVFFFLSYGLPFCPSLFLPAASDQPLTTTSNYGRGITVFFPK